jgi:hypothetical protein
VIPLRRASVTLGVILVLAGGCGYRAGGLMEDVGVRTVFVEVAGNESFRQRFEIPLTRRILEDLSVHSTVRPASASRADAVLEVDVRDIQGQILSEGGVGPIKEGAILVAMHVRLRDRATGRILREKKITDRAEYRVAIGETLSGAEEESVRDLARKVLLALEPAF